MFIPPVVVVGLILKLTIEFKVEIKIPKIRKPIIPSLEDGVSWGFFDGASQGNLPCCGAREVWYISNSHFFKVRYAPGKGSNMKEKL
jgi:hypothetical protein